ncbi:MAG: hypothetical protein ABMA14_02245 [Hyphomonadaceae bacterium]
MKPLTLAGCLLLAASQTSWAQEKEPVERDTVVIYGRALDLIGEAKSASEGIVGYADFQDRPLTHAGELVEVIPGAIATQHSGEGKANQYFLGGFNLHPVEPRQVRASVRYRF